VLENHPPPAQVHVDLPLERVVSEKIVKGGIVRTVSVINLLWR